MNVKLKYIFKLITPQILKYSFGRCKSCNFCSTFEFY